MNIGRILSVRARLALLISVVTLTLASAGAASAPRALSQAPNPCAVPGFALPARLLPTPGLNIFTAGDFNNDGRTDLVTLAVSGQYVLSFAAGNEAGGFDVPRAMALGFEPRTQMALKAADFNNDRRLDLLFIDGAANRVYVRLGDGAGSFGAAQPFAAGDTNIGSESANQTVIADFNNDGRLDVVVVTEFIGRIVVLLGNGLGGFNPPLTFTAPIFTPGKALAAGDFNADGKLDLIYLVQRSFQFFLLPGNGNGSFGAGVAMSYLAPGVGGLATPEDLLVADATGDGKLDVIVGGSRGVSIVPGNGAGGFADAVTYLRDAQLQDVVFADFDGDGRGDIATRGNTAITLLRGLAGGEFAEPVRLLPLSNENRFAKPVAADFDRDGLPDLLFATFIVSERFPMQGVVILPGHHSLGLAAPQSQPVEVQIQKMILADLNGDGALDLVATYVGQTAGFGVAFGDGTGRFGVFTQYPGRLPRSLVVRDFNRDGKPDVATSTPINAAPAGVRIWLNDGNGGLLSGQQISIGRQEPNLDAADFNNDGHLDLISDNDSAPSLRLLAGDGAGMFTTLTAQIPTGLFNRFVIGDFNGDGNADLATWASSTRTDGDQVVILSGDGRGGFSETARAALPLAASFLAAADLNGDGRTDLISSNFREALEGGFGVAVILANAAGFAAPVSYLGGEMSNIVVADVNGDNKPDLITASSLRYLNRGDGSFDGPARLNASGVLAVGDVNRDGANDLLIARPLAIDKSELFFISNTNPCAATTGAVTAASAASYRRDSLAPESIAALFGANLTESPLTATSLPLPSTLRGLSVRISDSRGVEHFAPLFFVSPEQVNLQIPPGVAPGTALLSVRNAGATIATGATQITAVSPGLFTANARGVGFAAGVVLRIKADGTQSYEQIAFFDPTQQSFVGRAIDLSSETDQVFLLLFGTGIRGRSSLAAVTAKIGNTDVPVLYAGPQGDFIGLDQVNLALPRTLAGSGVVEVTLTVEGQATAPLVLIGIK